MSNNEIKENLTISPTQTYPQSQQEYSNTYSQVENIGDFILDTRNIDNQEINTEKFKKGIDEYSSIAGKMAVLTSMGIDSRTALDFVERELAREHELKLVKTK